MARIRHVGITNFRCIEQVNWFPAPGINCLIGPGDAGKSSILDAIDLCLGARRTVQFTDADFHGLDVATPVVIRITIGDLSDALKSMETYGAFVRGYDPATGIIDDEPEAGKETVLTVQLTVGSDLDPVWSLVSDRAQAQGLSRNLTWGDRTRLSPTRIGALAESNLAWRRGSVLNRLTEEKADTSAALASAARDARKAFGNLADAQLGETLKIVADTARELGIPAGDTLKAMLDAHSVSFSGGTVALHGDDGVPLRALGVGSTRLLVAGLQRKAAKESSVLLVDELEHGLEPHRIIRLLGSIGAKETPPPIQAFVTTHSPVALRELRGDQLWITRKHKGAHSLDLVGTSDPIQGTIRAHPEAFLSRSVLVCEGASETGLMRGLDLWFSGQGSVSLNALGVALVDAGGVSKIYGRANVIARLGYRVASLRDDDVQPDASEEQAFQFYGGAIFKWAPGQALEHAIFHGVSDAAVHLLLERAIEIHGEELIADHISAASLGLITLAQCRGPVGPGTRQTLADASKWKKNAWFKTVTWMEEAARDIIGPDLPNATPAFQGVIGSIYQWAAVSDVDLLSIDRGTVTAPAGCGKTHLIALALGRHAGPKPLLVLTHTNAGVAALRARLDKAGVASAKYRLSTIDGWCMRLLTLFPKRSGHDPAILSVANPKSHYPAIRQAAAVLLRDGHINDVLAATYDRMIVDEYQDCSEIQHAIVYFAAQSLRTCVLGDPMQAIFGFQGNALADWQRQVCAHFPVVAELTVPWRWINACEEAFGRYLLEVRHALAAGQGVDLSSAPINVSWVRLDGQEDHQRRLRAGAAPAAQDERVLIIADSKNPTGQRQFASQIPGAVTVENVDMRDLVTFGEGLNLAAAGLLDHVVGFASSVMTNTGGANLLNRVATLRAGRERRPASPVEASAVRLVESPSYRSIAELLSEIGQEHGVRTHRPAILRGALRMLKSCGDCIDLAPADAAVQERERSRLIGRPLAKRTVGSTLLLKGLEADIAVILDPSEMDRRHLYVAMTRGAKRLVICSRDQRLTPA